MTLYPLYPQGKLDPQAEAILKQIIAAKAEPLASLTPQQAREQPLEGSWIGKPDSDVTTSNLKIPRGDGSTIPCRVYKPQGNPPYPMLVFFHGGGFVVGTLDEFNPFCTYLAAGASCIVVSVDYRLAPEHKHPAAVEDAVVALCWVVEHAADLAGDPTRVALAGDSAGANLAAVAAITARDQGFRSLVYQVLICPWLNSASFDTESFRYFGDGVWLSRASMEWYRKQYLQSEEQAKWYSVSPLLADDLSGLPPALIITAEFDVLRDEGEAYAQRLAQQGVSAQCTRYAGMLHDFVVLPGLFERAHNAINEICQTLQAAFIR